MKPQEMRLQKAQLEDWLKVASGINTPENRAKWPNYRNRGGAGPCEYCGEDSPWFICRNCSSMTCRSHHAAFVDKGAPIAYCILCKPSKFAENMPSTRTEKP